MSKTERIYALLVEANPVPDPDVLPEGLVDTEPHLRVIDPRRDTMHTEETTQPTTRERQPRRTWIPALVAAAAVVAAVAVGALLLTDTESEPSAEEVRADSAIAIAEAQLAAVNDGDNEAIIAQTTADGSNAEADGRMIEYNVAFAGTYPWQVQSCEATFASDEYVNVDCAFVNTDPVYVAEGVSELIAPTFVYDDGRVEWRIWQGANFSLANRAYADYLRVNHRTEYDAVCWPPGYAPAGSVNSNAGLALTKECADLALPLAQDIADWVEAGKPGS